MRAFYGRRGLPARLELREEVLERDRAVLEAAGFEEADLTLNLYEAAALAGTPSPHVAVKQTTDRAAWVRLATRAFADGAEPDEQSRQTAIFSAAGAQGLFIAEIDGAPAGAGAVAIAGEYAYLFSGAVLPEFRRRGVHTALLHARAAFGFGRDARWAAIKSLVGSEGEESVRRAGFERVKTLRRLTSSDPA